jgi:8-oxo-dGTP pyrophosphatase MutT (NUDIX family)
MASSVRNLRISDKPNEQTRQSAVCILLYPKADGWYIPLIVRPEYDGTHSGQVAFPGGKVEETDADVVATALREMSEEIGVTLSEVEVLGRLTPLFVFASNFMVHPIVAVTDQTPAFVPDPREVARILEVPVKDLLDESLRSEKEINVRGFRVQAPFFDFQGQTVWGATAMMLSEFAVLLNE